MAASTITRSALTNGSTPWNVSTISSAVYDRIDELFGGVGTYATLELGGALKINGALTQLSNDGGALGTSSLGWSDLFLASGAVINFNNGDVTLTHSTNTLTFAGATSGYIFNDGNVGIGVTPASILHLRGSAPTLTLDDSGNTTTTISYRPQAASYAERGAVSWNVATGEMRISAGASGGSFFQTFYTNGTERMRIDASGNVGIGVTPKTFTSGKVVEIGAAGNIVWGNGGGDMFVASNLYFNADFKYAATNAIAAVRLQDGIIKFLTAPSGTADTTATLTEHARVNNAGELLIGYTVDQGAYKLQVNSQIFATNATIATSDGRFKTDVQPVREGLAAVKALQPVQFKWKKHPVHNFIDGTDVGFIAQDVRTALTGRDYTGAVVTQNGSGESEFLGMADSKLIPLLVAAVQELDAKVSALNAQ